MASRARTWIPGGAVVAAILVGLPLISPTAALATPVRAGAATAAMGAAGPTLANPSTTASTTVGPARPSRPSFAPTGWRWRDYVSQRVTWSADTCSHDVRGIAANFADEEPGFQVECARVLAPLDWQDTRKGSITLQVTRTPRQRLVADSRPTRTLFVNPGGPGITADWFAPVVSMLEPSLRQGAQIIAIDPRGTGGSTPLACTFIDDGVTDHDSPSGAEIAAQQKALREAVAACAAKAPDYLPNITTTNTIRDHDLVRALVGAQQVDWLGLSAGTWMGARFAQLFPSRVGRFVLDSNTDFSTDWRGVFAWQPKGFQRRFDSQFLAWVARHDDSFHLGASAAAVKQRFLRLRTAAGSGDLADVTPDALDRVVVAGLYTDDLFSETAAVLAALDADLSAGRRTLTPATRTALAALPLPTTGVGVAGAKVRTWASAEDTVMMAIQCNDTAWTRSAESYVEEGMRQGQAYPLLGYTWVATPCAYWPYPPRPFPAVDGAGVPTMLMVQAELDPATPWEGAILANRANRATRLLTVDNQGNHGSFLGGNDCVEDAVNGFLVEGRLPPAGAVCPGLPLPGEDRVVEVGTRQPTTRPPADQRFAPVNSAAATALRAEVGRRLAAAGVRR